MAAQNDKLAGPEIVLAELVSEGGTTPVQKWLAEQRKEEPFGVPSRFGIGTLLVVTAAYGLLLTLLRSLLDWDPRAIAWFVVFVSLIGAGQMLLFGSRRPRQASLITGAIALPMIVILTFVLHVGGHSPPDALLCSLCSATLFGAPAGYLAGGVVAGVFLVMDAVQRGLTRLFPPKKIDEEGIERRERLPTD
jgi:hypothetical protein